MFQCVNSILTHCESVSKQPILIWPTPRVAWNLAALFNCWYFQLSSTLTPNAGGGGKGSPSSPGEKKLCEKGIYLVIVQGEILSNHTNK